MKIDDLIKQNESERLDFKRDYKGPKDSDLIHDLLSMANTPCDGERRIVFGISDNKEVIGIPKEIQAHEINNFLTQAPLNMPFSVQVENLLYRGKKISIIVIPENQGDIYTLRSEKFNLLPNNIYTRNGCTNTGKRSTSSPDIVYKIALRKLKKDSELKQETQTTESQPINTDFDVFKEFHKAIKDRENWATSYDIDFNRNEEVKTYFYRRNMKFIIKEFEDMKSFHEPWAQAKTDPRAYSYKLVLYYDSVKIREETLVLTDGARDQNVVPIHKIFKDSERKFTHYYYYIQNTIKHDLNLLINKDQINDYVSPRGDIPIFKSAEEADASIQNDYDSNERLILSYSGPTGRTSRYGIEFAEYEEFPKMFQGKIIPRKDLKK